MNHHPYRELVVEGPRGWTFGYVEGYLAGRGSHVPLFDAEDVGFDVETLRERLREVVFRDTATLHLLVREADVGDVRAGLAAAGAHCGRVDVRSDRPIAGARFGFRFETFSEERAADLRSWFAPDAAGDGVAIEASFEEQRDPEAKGTEAYAPAHHYRLAGEGTVSGDVAGVVALYRRCRGEDLVHEGAISLVTD